MENHENADFTKSNEKVKRSQYGGLPANALFIPIAVILAILQVVVVILMATMFTQSGKLSQVTQESNAYASEATSLLAGMSLLSETSNNYVLMPITSQGEPNVGPLVAYTGELAKPEHRGDTILADFETYHVNEQTLQNIRDAAQSANAMIEMQNHALALTCAVYPYPDIPPLAGLQLPELSADEAALSDDEKLKQARTILLDTEFGTQKNSVSENVNAAVANIQAISGQQARDTAQLIGMLRLGLVGVSVAIFLVLVIMFVLFYRFLISPLGRFSRLIVNGDALDENQVLHETRLLAGSYNELLHRRDALEEILREAAETDTLTGLPNRYSFKQHLVEEEDRQRSLTVFLFDVDHLKTTNDTYGHAAGDDLIRRAAYCIATCFGATDAGRCYRISGDEFAAVIWGLEESDIPAFAQKFEELQPKNNVSVSWGYSYSPARSAIPFRALMDEADQHMYQMKERVHERGCHDFAPDMHEE